MEKKEKSGNIKTVGGSKYCVDIIEQIPIHISHH